MLWSEISLLILSIGSGFCQYGLYGGGYGGMGGMPYLPDPFLGSQMYGYGNPMMGRLGSSGLYGSSGVYGSSGMYGSNGMCQDLSPQCSVWASTGQCATNPMTMRQACALSCGTCATGLGSASLYNPFSLGMPSELGQYPLSQFIGRSIYETGILRQPTPHSSTKDVMDRLGSRSGYLPDR